VPTENNIQLGINISKWCKNDSTQHKYTELPLTINLSYSLMVRWLYDGDDVF
jgi:hypothetical protein